MKAYIDLLPEAKRREVKREKAIRTILAQEMGFTFPVLLFLAILFSINIVLKIQSESMEEIYRNDQAMKGYQELNGFEDKFKAVNSQLATVSKIQENHFEWASILTKLGQLFPDGVYVSGIATKDYKLFLIGKAQKREDLLKFQEAINSSECFSNVNAPLSNLVSKENIDFQIDFEVKKNCLKSQ